MCMQSRTLRRSCWTKHLHALWNLTPARLCILAQEGWHGKEGSYDNRTAPHGPCGDDGINLHQHNQPIQMHSCQSGDLGCKPRWLQGSGAPGTSSSFMWHFFSQHLGNNSVLLQLQVVNRTPDDWCLMFAFLLGRWENRMFSMSVSSKSRWVMDEHEQSEHELPGFFF
jgi:hypothetical protein